MAYQVLARKWRPQTFAEVVGQEHISRTLKNAIVQNRIGHAYLFVGSRGIGKTTSARIFAKALNCAHNVNGEPCCQCESCREIAAGNSMDVIEIDGASHNKVEDIRDIRDNVQYTPTHGRFKIYIIDEVHMLTPQAWNALLKTLEEPPDHVKFIFATTEPHKVLPTIISRCQRFDLKRIPVPLITQRLRQIADGEGIHVEENALAAIARAADGGMRDAQSIFDQMIAFCGGLKEGELITEQDVIDVFGLASGTELREIAAGIFSNDINRSLVILQKMADSGRDLERLFSDLIAYIRNLMIAGVSAEPAKILEVSDTELNDLVTISKSMDAKLIQRVLQELVAQEWNFRAALNKRIYFEAVLARVVLAAHSVQLDDIIRQLNVLNGTMPALQTPVDKPNPFGASIAAPVPAPTASVAAAPVAPAPVPATPAAPVTPVPVAPVPAPVAPEAATPPSSPPVPPPVALSPTVETAPLSAVSTPQTPSSPSGNPLPPDSIYTNMPVDMPEGDDADMSMLPQPVLPEINVPADHDDEQKGTYRRPTLEEFDALEKDSFVRRVARVFRTRVVDARLKE